MEIRSEMRNQRRDGRSNPEQGQGLLEFAMVVGILLLLLFGIIDFSRLFFGYATMANGVREGARYAVVHPDDEAGIKAAAHAMMLVVGAPVSVTVDFPGLPDSTDPGCKGRLCAVVVTAVSEFPVWTPILPNIQIEAHATMHIE